MFDLQHTLISNFWKFDLLKLFLFNLVVFYMQGVEVDRMEVDLTVGETKWSQSSKQE